MKIKSFLFGLLIVLSTSSFSQDGFVGEVRLFAGNFAPRDWAFCNGQVLNIMQYQALFSLLGTTYGGNGVQTFALPDLRSRVPVHVGYSVPPGLSPIQLGEKGGTETVTITPSMVIAQTTGVSLDVNTTGRDGAPSVVQSVVVKNQSPTQVSSVRDPYLGMNYIICLNGLYPMRN